MRNICAMSPAWRATYLLLVVVLFPASHYSQSENSSASGTDSKPSAVHPHGDFVRVHDARLWYESEGSGEPLVLIAGGPGFSHDYFHPFFTPLSSSFRVIYFDAFGRGKSDHAKNPHEYSLDRDVEDIEGLRQALGLGKINLLGHSYGGFVAQAFALRYPGSLRRLILAAVLSSAARSLR